MKKILLVTAPISGVHTSAQESIAKVVQEEELPVERILSTVFLVEGDKPVEVVLRLADIASHHNLPCAVFELESELFRRT